MRASKKLFFLDQISRTYAFHLPFHIVIFLPTEVSHLPSNVGSTVLNSEAFVHYLEGTTRSPKMTPSASTIVSPTAVGGGKQRLKTSSMGMRMKLRTEKRKGSLETTFARIFSSFPSFAHCVWAVHGLPRFRLWQEPKLGMQIDKRRSGNRTSPAILRGLLAPKV